MVDATQPAADVPARAGGLQAGTPSERPRLPVRGVIAGSFRIFAAAPLLFLALGGVAQLVTATRLILDPAANTKFDRGQLIAILCGKLLYVLIQTMITHAAVRLGARESASVAEGLRLAVRRYLPMLGLSILILLIVYAGFILLIVPGFIATTVLAVTVPVCALEGAGPITSIRRSAFLTKGERWRIFGLYCLLMLPFILLLGGITYTLTLKGHLAAGQWVGFAVTTVWVPFATIVSAEIYTQLRRLKENFGVSRIFE